MNKLEQNNSEVKPSQQLDKLLKYWGIISCFKNYAGDVIEIPHSTKLATLAFMGVKVKRNNDIDKELQQIEKELYGNWLKTAIVLAADTEQSLTLLLPINNLSSQFTWAIHTELGGNLTGAFQGSQLIEIAQHELEFSIISSRKFTLPALPPGYHKLTLDNGSKCNQATLIVAPSSCYEPQWTKSDTRLAGVSVQLYSLRSERNWGIGDFTDLRKLIDRSAYSKLDFIVLNPLHLLDELQPEQCSPYSPMDRRFLNPLYLDLESEPDFQDSAITRSTVAEREFQKELGRLRWEGQVDYVAVTQLKYRILLHMFEQFQKLHIDLSSTRGAAFIEWLKQKGDALTDFVMFQASRSAKIDNHARNPRFHGYLQWLAELQLESCQQRALDLGMSIGLIRDLAVGSKRNSAEVQLNPELFCDQASIGAPPDPLAPQGQNWGLPPMNPSVLQRTSYRHYIELLKDNMTHCGALRIDHVMALMRLWWSPQVDQSGSGTYVNYPAEELFSILRLESQRNRCVVVGEDLGIVPPQVRKLMSESGIFSNVLFYFEKYDGLRFKNPGDFPPKALSMVANHDVPTLAAWWNKFDLMLRNQIGLIRTAEELVATISARESDLIQVLHWLNEQNLLPEYWQDFNIHKKFDHTLCKAIVECNGRSASKLVCVQLEDLILMETPINIPGTSSEYPNWRRKLSVNIDELFDDEIRRNLLETFVEARRQ